MAAVLKTVRGYTRVSSSLTLSAKNKFSKKDANNFLF